MLLVLASVDQILAVVFLALRRTGAGSNGLTGEALLLHQAVEFLRRSIRSLDDYIHIGK